MNSITERVLKQLGDEEIIDKLLSLSRTDLNSLLLEVFDKQAEKLTPVDMLKAHQASRFSTPSDIDPVKLYAIQAQLLTVAQEMDIQTVSLSPAAPFGSCSVFGCVDQYNVVSALRGTEVLPDPTNMLAVIIADKLKTGVASNASPLHCAATERVLRAQSFSGEGFFAHFGIFCMVSSGKDIGSYGTEKALLEKHLFYYKEMFQKRFNAKLSIVLQKRGGYKDGDGFFERMAETIRTALPDAPLSFDTDETDNKYYQGINFKIMMDTDQGQFELGDGGFVDWMYQMLGNKKERCLISGIGIDRLILFSE